MSKKDKKLLMDKLNKVIDDVGRANADHTSGMSSSGTATLEDLRRQYETVAVKIKKKNKAGDWALFAQLDNQPPKNLIEIGLDVLCMEQGGGGEYDVWVQPPGASAMKFWGGSIMGVSYDVAKMYRDSQGPFTGILGGAAAPLVAGAPVGGYDPQLLRSMDVVAKQGETNTDRLMMMQLQMQQQQAAAADRQFQIAQAAADKQMQMMMMMLGRKEEPARSGPSESEVAMREELRRMREEREHDRRREEDRRHQELERRISEQKNDQMVEMMKVGNRGDKDTGSLIASVFANSQQQAAQQQLQYLQLMEKVMDRPSEGEKIGELANVMLNTQMGQMQLMTQAMQSGLFGGSDSKHPVLEAVKEGISALREMGGRAMPPMPEGYEEEEEEMPQPERHGRGQVMREQPQQLPAGPMGATHPSQEAWNVPAPESAQMQVQIPAEALVTKEDLERLEKDRALVPVTAIIMRGDPATDIPLRLYVYATTGGSKFAAKWLQFPLEVTVQVCSFLDVPQVRAQEVLDAIAEFIQFVTPVEDGGQGHKPNEWGGNYTPKRKSPEKHQAAQAQHAAASYGGGNGGAPEIGVSRVPPTTQAEAYDSSKLPDGVSPEQAEALDKQARAALASLQPPTEPSAS